MLGCGRMNPYYFAEIFSLSNKEKRREEKDSMKRHRDEEDVIFYELAIYELL